MFSFLTPPTRWFNARVVHVLGVYALYVVVHFVTPYLYVRLCTPWTLMGFLASPFVAPAPHCRALRWTFQHTASHIDAMWLLIGTSWVTVLTVQPLAATVTAKDAATVAAKVAAKDAATVAASQTIETKTEVTVTPAAGTAHT